MSSFSSVALYYWTIALQNFSKSARTSGGRFLNDAHSRAYEVVRKIRCAGEVVGNAA
jgi:hypothetical protein